MCISAFGLCVCWKLANLKDLIRERENIELLTFFLPVFSSSVLADWAVVEKNGLGQVVFLYFCCTLLFFLS